MSRIARAGGALSLGFVVLAAVAGADEGTGTLFDGGPGPKVEAPAIEFKATTPPAPAPAAPAMKKGADLYYFTPEEAAAAAEAFRFAPKANGWSFDSDVPAAIQTQMRADLAFMAGIKGSGATPLHQQIFGKVDGAAYKEFFDSRVSKIGMSGCGNGNAVACVIPFLGPSKMWLTENFIKFDHPQISRMMVVYHEARHTEMSHLFWGHATCPDPFRDANGNDMKSIWTGALLAGEPACDKTALGSYGSSTILLKNVQKHCANCTAKVRMDAGLYADDQLGRITDARARGQMEDDFRR